jgi:hypothetical protein
MKRILLATATALLMLGSAEAKINMTTEAKVKAATDKATTLYKGKVWQTYVVKDTDNRPMCGMQVNGSDSALFMKYAGNEVFLQLYKLGWSIPKGTEIPGWLKLDNDRFPIIGVGNTTEDTRTGYVEFFVKEGTETEFLNRLTDTKAMQIGFDQGTEKPFNVVMLDSRDAVKTFMDCAKVIDTPTPQPFAQPAKGPQPFSAKKAGDCSEDMTVGTPAPPLPPELRAPCVRREDGSI